MQTRRPGARYGLTLAAPKARTAAAAQQARRPAAAAAAAAAPLLAAFRDDGEDDVEADIARQALKKRSQREVRATISLLRSLPPSPKASWDYSPFVSSNLEPKVEDVHSKALQQDPLVFDYDGVYDDIKAAKARPAQEDKARRESKYIGKLLDKAKQREREQDVVYERKLAKERAAEEHLYGDKDKFVTKAYRQKLAEQKQWLEDERRREAAEAKNDVTKKSDLSDFYRNLLSKNEAFGAPAGGAERGRATAADPATTSSAATPVAEAASLPSPPVAEASPLARPPGAAALLQEGPASTSVKEPDAETAISNVAATEEGGGGPLPASNNDEMGRIPQGAAASSPPSDSAAAKGGDDKVRAEPGAGLPRAVDATAARERYLARKKQRS
eukprot:SM000051S17544  [mRNA]  locus=s51:277474:279874:+ [translate_table: standard]